ncbi:MAG: hypothetical protein Q9180_004708, partial [Flavoplaca navasiana]
MIPWRCEYTYMLLAWPIACVVWLLFAFALLLFMKETIDIYNPANLDQRYTLLGLMLLPYKVRFAAEEPRARQHPDQTEKGMRIAASSCAETISSSSENSSLAYPPTAPRYAKPSATEDGRSDDISVPRGSNCVTIRITMPSIVGWRSWR